MAEWLRRWTRNPLGSARAGSNPADCATFTDHMLDLLWSTCDWSCLWVLSCYQSRCGQSNSFIFAEYVSANIKLPNRNALINSIWFICWVQALLMYQSFKMCLCTASVVVSCKIPILATRVRFPGSAIIFGMLSIFQLQNTKGSHYELHYVMIQCWGTWYWFIYCLIQFLNRDQMVFCKAILVGKQVVNISGTKNIGNVPGWAWTTNLSVNSRTR